MSPSPITMTLTEFASNRTKAKRQIIRGGFVQLTEQGEHIATIVPADAEPADGADTGPDEENE